MYGEYNFWSWFRYWYLDSCNLVTMLQIDKGYFDYDYEKTEKPEPIVNWEDTIKDDDEVNDLLSIFGLGGKKDDDDEYLQNYILEEEQKDGSTNSGNH